ncbi:MAG: T9SS type A sorting domain-containing protein, partial [Cyclobacteriaceae bacterium]|nr:T9SS type A sorting domain-containing protein [Cyclobacteriaceae bacterium]
KIENNGNITHHSRLKTPEIFLMSNYPNPFYRYTHIRFNINHSGYYKMRVVDLLGKEIIVLLNRFLPEGEREIIWNSKNQNGKYLIPGIYLVELNGNGEKQVIKIILE